MRNSPWVMPRSNSIALGIIVNPSMLRRYLLALVDCMVVLGLIALGSADGTNLIKVRLGATNRAVTVAVLALNRANAHPAPNSIFYMLQKRRAHAAPQVNT